MDQRETRLNELRDRIASGRYTVDPLVVADAIVHRRSSRRVAGQPVLQASGPAWRHGPAPVSPIAHPRAERLTEPLAA
jgi:hypothetical protein